MSKKKKKQLRLEEDGYKVLNWDLTLRGTKKQLKKAIEYCYKDDMKFHVEPINVDGDFHELHIEGHSWASNLQLFGEFLDKECDFFMGE